MLERALAVKVPFAWFTADEAYGQVGYLWDWLEHRDVFYVMATRCDHELTTRTARTDELVAEFADRSWQRLSVGADEHGPRGWRHRGL
ncbi:hypothetical protein [Nocardia sp. NPDC047654]|uniref:hypothetical protein n=1 Tax=Nocardia sp. NPDC047654 TaxID=3364314 RepID=UPI003710311A